MIVCAFFSLAFSAFDFFVADDTLFAMAGAAVFTVMGLKGWDTPGVRQSCTGAFDPHMAVGETPGQWEARADATIKKRQERAKEDKIHHDTITLVRTYQIDLAQSRRSFRILADFCYEEETKFKRRIKGMKTRTHNLRATIDKKSDEIRKLKAKVRELKKAAAA